MIRGRLSCRNSLVLFIILIMWWPCNESVFAQGRFTDVLVSVMSDKVVAVTGVGESESGLSVGETVVSARPKV
jgi:hypothetical protein